MEFEEQENGNLVYKNGEKVYTLVNMKDYVGSRNRDPYENATDCWRLMFYDEKREKDTIHIEALVDTSGYYSRIMVVSDKFRRTIMLKGNFVEEDKIFEMNSENDFIPTSVYVAYEDPFQEKRPLEFDKYIEKKVPFLSEDNKTYSGVVSSNDLIVDFVNSNIELSELASERSEGMSL